VITLKIFPVQCIAILPKMTRVFAELAVTGSGQRIESPGLVAETDSEVIDVKFADSQIFVRWSSGNSRIFQAAGPVLAVAFADDSAGIRVKTMGHRDSIIHFESGMHHIDFMQHVWLETPNSGVFLNCQIIFEEPMGWLCSAGRKGYFGGPNAVDGVFMMVISATLCRTPDEGTFIFIHCVN